MVNITFDMFFDRAGVVKHIRDGTKSVLAKAGAFGRRTMKGIIRSGKKPAKPGNPPKSHSGTFKELIFFGYDESTESMVYGPQLFKKGDPPVPQLLNEGGIGVNSRTRKPATYRAFPFVEPTLDIEAPKFPELFTNSIK